MMRDFPQAILHVDGDGFFASCEQALNPKLKGKPVVTGRERGIASAMSYEAKARGVTRGMTLWQIRQVCPEAIILPSDYETYSLISKRMYAIVRRYTTALEEYGIDECFADLTGLDKLNKCSYEEMAAAIKAELEGELNMTFSLGLAPTKVLAKIGSKWAKPSGLTVIRLGEIEKYLKDLPLERVWGIGGRTAEKLRSEGIKTVLDFASQSEWWIRFRLAKPLRELWQELRGVPVLTVNTEAKASYQSISKTKTFTPPTAEKSFLLSQLSRNVEGACIKVRRYGLVTDRVSFFLKTQDFRYLSFEFKLPQATAAPSEIVSALFQSFEQVYNPRYLYRTTGVTLNNLSVNEARQLDLFGEQARSEEKAKIYEAIDHLSERYGKYAVCLGSSLRANLPQRQRNLITGETLRRRLNIPLMGEVN
jgi:DNA polymerase IV